MSKEFKSKKPKKYEKWWFVLEDATISYFAKKVRHWSFSLIGRKEIGWRK